MRQYAIRRIIQFFAISWGAATLDFVIPHLSPTHPVRESKLTRHCPRLS